MKEIILQDPNLEIYVAEVLKPIRKQMSILKAEVKQLKQVNKNKADVIRKYLKDNLSIQISTQREQEYEYKYVIIEVSVSLENKEICKSSDTIRM